MSLKYKDLYQRLSAAIDSGGYAPGQKLPTEAEMSRWGFSRNTVRQALALLEQEGRILKQRGSSSMVKPLHRSATRSGNVAVVVQDFQTTVFPQLLEGISDGLYGWGTPMLYSAGGEMDEEARILRELQNKDIEGILVNGLFTALPNPNLPLYQSIIDREVPIIFLLSQYNGLQNSINVINDDVGGGAMAVRHLYEQGRRRPCGIFNSDFIHGLERYEGFVNGCRALEMDILSQRILWLHSRDFLYAEVFADKVLKLVAGCDSLVCSNDYIGHTAAKILLKAGLRIPEDIALICFDNTYLCDYPPVPLTSLDGSPFETGRQAAGKLKNILAGKRETSVKLPWTLVKRQST